jgi:hypothetical protein
MRPPDQVTAAAQEPAVACRGVGVWRPQGAELLAGVEPASAARAG